MNKVNHFTDFLIMAFGLGFGLLAGYKSPIISLFILAIIAGAIIVLKDFAVATYTIGFYVFIDYFIRKYLYQIASVWDELFFIALFMLWMLKWFLNRQKSPEKELPLDIPIFIYFAANLFILLVNSPKLSLAIEGVRANIQYVLIYFLVANLLQTRKHAKYLTYAIVFAIFLLSLHGIYQYIVKVPMPPQWLDAMESNIKTRVFSIIGSPNILGSLLLLLAPVSFSLFLGEQKLIKKLIFLGIGASMSLCLVFTFSRGAWFGFVIAMFALAVVYDKRFLLPMGVAGILVLVFVPSISHRITYMLSSEYIASSLQAGRLIRWITGLEMFADSMWVGVGAGHFGGAVAMNNAVKDTFYMDNYYLKTAVEMGLVGLLAFVYLMYSVIAWSYRSFKKANNKYDYYLLMGVFAGLTGVVFHNFVENIFEVPVMVVYFYTLAGISMHLWHVNRIENIEQAV